MKAERAIQFLGFVFIGLFGWTLWTVVPPAVNTESLVSAEQLSRKAELATGSKEVAAVITQQPVTTQRPGHGVRRSWISREGVLMGQQTYTSGSGNWTVPNGVTSVTVLLIGGGGGGASGGFVGGGGGGGSISRTGHTVTPAESIAYSVGAGGAPDGAGGNTTFDGLTAGGGGFGQYLDGGAGGTGDYTGGAGNDGTAAPVAGGGGSSGGRSSAGNSGGLSAGGSAVSEGGSGGNGATTGGVSGSSPGGGGGGDSGGEGFDGGTGGAGYIQIDWTDPEESNASKCWCILQQKTQATGESMWDLRQSTASQEIPLGTFLNSTDLSVEDALTIANTDIQIFKTGATASVNKNSGGATADADGNYYAVLDTTDTGTIGPLKIVVQMTGCLPVTLHCRVLHANIFDQLYGSSAIGGTGLDAAATRAALGLASANLDTQLSAIDTVVDSILVDTAEIGTAGAGLTVVATQASVNTIDDFLDTEIAAIKTKTDQLTFTVANQVDSNALSGGGGLDAAGVRAAVGLASANLDTQLGAIDDFLDTEVAAIKAKTDNLPSDPADASDIASSFSTVNTKLDAIDDFLDTEVAAIKTKTDQLTFTVANKVDATATLSAADSMVLSSGTATAGGNKTITLQTALGADNMGIGCKIKITSGTGSKQMRRVAGYVNSTQVLTVDRAWTTNPDNTSVYSVVYDSDVGPTVCRYGAAFTSSAGTTLKISAWLERDGQAVVLASGSCTVTYRENASGSDLFTITDSAPNAQGIFEMSQTSPGFTSDRLQVASIEITVGNDTWITREPVPVFG